MELPLDTSTSYLRRHRLPAPSFAPHDGLSEVLRPVWSALDAGDLALALRRVRQALHATGLATADDRAALLAAFAAAEWQRGGADAAKRLAEHALALQPAQWLAHRTLLDVFAVHQEPEAAYLYLTTLDLPETLPAWDAPLALRDQHLALAGWAWRMKDWDAVAEHLAVVFPTGIEELPAAMLEDWFRLALYRDRPEDAAEAATLLIEQGALDRVDALLQAIVQRGWTGQALPLYRTLYERMPESEMLRRRLVGLCLREGAVEEARLLTRSGALRLVA